LKRPGKNKKNIKEITDLLDVKIVVKSPYYLTMECELGIVGIVIKNKFYNKYFNDIATPHIYGYEIRSKIRRRLVRD